MYGVRQIFVDIRPAPILIVQSKYSAGSQPIGPYIMLLWWHGVIPDVRKYSHNVLVKLNWSVRERNEKQMATYGMLLTISSSSVIFSLFTNFTPCSETAK